MFIRAYYICNQIAKFSESPWNRRFVAQRLDWCKRELERATNFGGTIIRTNLWWWMLPGFHPWKNTNSCATLLLHINGNASTVWWHTQSLSVLFRIPGRRSCLGEVLARQEVFLLFAAILQHFIVLPPEGQNSLEVEEVYRGLLFPLPYEVRLVPRKWHIRCAFTFTITFTLFYIRNLRLKNFGGNVVDINFSYCLQYDLHVGCIMYYVFSINNYWEH